MEKVLVVYEEHYSRGPARTEWHFDPKPLTMPEFVGGGTHRKFIAVFVKGTRAMCVRTSNRGNVHVREVLIEGNCFLDFLGNVCELPQKYVDYARVKGLYP